MGQEAFLSEQIVGLSESIDDRVAALLVAGTGITLTYNDGAGTLTIASTVSPAWGSIGGTLSSQTDLQTALDAKAATTHTHVIADTTGLQAALNAKLGGSTGSTDNRILRADGTGGVTAQSSAVAIDDSGNISGLGTVGCGAITSSGTITANTSFVTSTLTLTGGSPSSVASSNRLTFYSSAAYIFYKGGNSFTLDPSGSSGATFGGGIAAASGTFSGLVTVGTYTVATLPSAAANAGALAQVTDSSVTANGSAVAGGGANRVAVYSNGSTWDVVVA